jgi:hypothetical protein
MIKRWLTGAGVALLLFVIVGIYLAGRDEVNPPSATGPVILSHGLARGERVTSHSWSLDYDKITTSADQTFVTLDGIRDGVIFRKGKPYLHLHAAHVNVNMVTHDFTATGPIHIESAGPHDKHFHAFDTTAITWIDGEQRLEMTEPIVVTSPGTSLHVQKLSLNIRTGELRIDQADGSFRE